MIEEMRNTSNSLRRWISEFGYGKVKPDGASDPRWKSLKEWCQEYMAYCNDFGEQPKNKNAVTEMFKRMGLEKARRSDGMWYCMGVVERPAVLESGPVGGLADDMPEFRSVPEDLLPF